MLKWNLMGSSFRNCYGAFCFLFSTKLVSIKTVKSENDSFITMYQQHFGPNSATGLHFLLLSVLLPFFYEYFGISFRDRQGSGQNLTCASMPTIVFLWTLVLSCVRCLCVCCARACVVRVLCACVCCARACACVCCLCV